MNRWSHRNRIQNNKLVAYLSNLEPVKNRNAAYPVTGHAAKLFSDRRSSRYDLFLSFLAFSTGIVRLFEDASFLAVPTSAVAVAAGNIGTGRPSE